MKRSFQNSRRWRSRAAVLTLVVACVVLASNGRASGAANVVQSLREWTRDSRSESPTLGAVLAQQTFGERLVDLLLLRQYNTRVVLLGTSLLGVTAGVVGVFMLLRKQALVGDVVGHSALPGIATAFLVMELIHAGSGKSLPGLLAGAFVAGLVGAVCVLLIDRFSRIKSDAALAIVLSVFYGAGAALF